MFWKVMFSSFFCLPLLRQNSWIFQNDLKCIAWPGRLLIDLFPVWSVDLKTKKKAGPSKKHKKNYRQQGLWLLQQMIYK